jgi:hypothetical protein
MNHPIRLALCGLVLASLLACSLPSAIITSPPPAITLVTVGPDATSTPTPFQPAPVVDLPTETPFPSETPTELPTLTSTAPPPSPTEPASSQPGTPAPSGDRTQYLFYAQLDYASRTLAADETIRYYNTTGQALNEIVMAVPPNLSGAFSLNSLTQDDTPLANYSLVGERMSVILPASLAPGAATTFKLSFSLSIPPKRYEATFGYSGDQVNLTDWYPFIVPFDGGWILHDPWAFGEHLVYDSSDFELNLKVSDPSVTIAASAPMEPNGEWMRYRIYGARTIVFSASTSYLVSDSAVGNVAIRTYYFAGYEGAGDGLLRAALSAVGLFDAKFGPYPYDSLSVVQSDLPDGQEFDGLVFLGTKFYAEYGGSARSNLITIGVHEISHEWWFGLVGNDQAMEPWLDEALAIYSENTFYTYNFPRFGDWWWNFRVNYFGPTGWVDSSIYDHGTFRSYVNATYLNGANFLYDLNQRMGGDEFYRFLRDYASRFGRRRATTADFFAVLREDSGVSVDDLISAYFKGSY